MSSPPRPMRGEIWEFDLDPRAGGEPKRTRPCLVVSTDAMNRSAFGTVIVCPVTPAHRPGFRWRVALEPADLHVAARTWKSRTHWVATDQIVTVDAAERAIRHLATVASDAKLERVDASLRLMLDLRD